MQSSIRGAAVVCLLVGLTAVQPEAAAGQEAAPVGAEAQQQIGSERSSWSCAAAPAEVDAFLIEVARARELESPEAAKVALDALEPEARRMAADAPDDAAMQYRLAAVMGARLDHAKGSKKMSGAEQLRDQAQRVLELDPQHAGASYMLGKLHASVLRLSGFKRFMARQLFGGGALEGASWEEAQRLLEVAVREDPCIPEHHFELARVYAKVGDEAGAERELAAARDLTEGRDGRQAARLREKVDEFEKEWRQETGRL